MYRCFNHTLPNNCFRGYDDNGRPDYAARKTHAQPLAESLKAPDGSTISYRPIADWFPEIDCQVASRSAGRLRWILRERTVPTSSKSQERHTPASRLSYFPRSDRRRRGATIGGPIPLRAYAAFDDEGDRLNRALPYRAI